MSNYMRYIRKNIFDISAKDISDEDLFSSPHYFNYLASIITTSLIDINREIKFKFFYNKRSNITAYTSETEITVNCASPIILNMTSRKDKYLATIGHIVHECGHVLFTNFRECINYFETIEKGEWYPTCPSNKVKAEEISEAIKNNNHVKNMILNALKQIDNSVDDVYIETKMCQNFSGLFSLGIHTSASSLYDYSQNLEQLIQNCLDTQKEGDFLYDYFEMVEMPSDKRLKVYLFPMILSQILMVARYGEIKMNGEAKTNIEYLPYYTELEKLFSEITPLIKELTTIGDYTERYKKMNELLLRLWEYIEPLSNLPEPKSSEDGNGEGEKSDESSEGENSKNEETKEGSSTNNSTASKGKPSKEELEEAMANALSDISDTIDEDMDKVASTVSASGSTVPINSKESTETKADAKTTEEANKIIGEKNISEIAKTIIEEIAKEQAEEQHTADLQKECNNIFDNIKGDEYSNSSVVVARQTGVSFEQKEEYQEILEPVLSVSKATQRKLGAVLKERNIEGRVSGLVYGKRLSVNNIYHNDGKLFAKDKEPTGKPQLAVCVLIDESGSMCGSKIQKARQTAILLEDILRNLDIATLVVGHSADIRETETDIYPYVDFDKVDGNDRYRLALISDRANNRDGVAITYCCEKLLKRAEYKKLLIVISDGEPAAYSYRDGIQHTKKVVAKYSKKGIETFAAAIDGNMKHLNTIYGDKLMEIDNLNDLPTVLVRLVKRYILRK